MKKFIVIIILSSATAVFVSFSRECLRSIYSQRPVNWPKPLVEDGVNWTELGPLPKSPLHDIQDSLRHVIELGKTLFFDTRLSASNKISCATCHQPELNWTDGKEKSVGHEGTVTKRNSPTIQNTWFYHRLFWDGRAKDLQDQAFAPIVSESEMGSDMPDVMRKLRRINGYKELFKKAYGDENINPDRMTEAIAVFEKTIVSGKSRFDEFMEGNKKALSKNELRGLHLFRTKAKCMNCHHGPLFTDNLFHNAGFSGDDKGLYMVTHKDEDMGKFKTPSLRDVMRTVPWMHNGSVKDMTVLIEHFNRADGPGADKNLIKPLNLTVKEKKDLLAFLNAISAAPAEFKKPVMPE